ncbi:natural killer cells antigen CD94 [Suncus etruscus]|uniref:natural killer cells antigen CD94 n=1 Tax=Suncus etruscus TaxID=109475 RepID=UPI00210FA6FD|nr:natural killer cells antigen CD94 [Suncus etruscus]
MVPRTIPWKWISGILGVMCVLLLAIVGVLIKMSFHKQSIEPEFTMDLQEDFGCCPCQDKWVGYKCNCYFISDETKIWEESRNFCVSQNSSLLQMQKSDELHFMRSSKYFYWTGISYSEDHGRWLWLNGSSVSPDVLEISSTTNTNHCIAYSPRKTVLSESCSNKNRYICKQ